MLKGEWMGWIRRAKGVKKGSGWGGSDERRVLKRGVDGVDQTSEGC